MRKNRRALPVIFTVILLFCPGSPPAADEFRDRRASRQTSHYRSVADKFIDSLAIKPGMTILDIGTGTGQFALGFAERLGSTGRVFATDIDNSCINELKEEARRRGLNNLYPVSVTHDGVDEFYGRQKYDLVTVMHVSIHDKTAYFARMRDYLADDGRLVVVGYKSVLPFSEADFAGRFPEVIMELSLEPPGSPFSRGLRESTRNLLRKASGTNSNGELRKAVIDDFNRMLRDARFGAAFVAGGVITEKLAFTPSERGFAEFLLRFLEEYDLFFKNPETANPREIAYAMRFNKLLFLQRFRPWLHDARLFVPRATRASVAPFEKAGFRFEKRDLDTMPFEEVLVFTRDVKRNGSSGLDGTAE